ncbi:MAG: SMC-Scp complex subunit ScpB [Deltaproteobacteria bacterium]|nr:SMC-Scp complex subunit ScpB [Deltaproteobacteria bacterium]
MDLKKIIEVLIFVSGKGLGVQEILETLKAVPENVQTTSQEVVVALETLQKEWEERGGGIQLVPVAEGYELRTTPEYAPWIQALNRPKPHRLSNAAAETLALIAYRQPITKTDIETVRGVDSGGVLKSLLDRHFIRIVGRKEEAGRPLIYATSKDFLEIFGLKDLDDLPPLKEFEEKAKTQVLESAEKEEFTVADLAITQEELVSLDDEDREAMQALDQSLKDLKEFKDIALTALTEQSQEESILTDQKE